MNKVKESRIYSNFFKANYWLILAPVVILTITSLLVVSQLLPTTHHQAILLEMEYSTADINQKSLLTDEAVQVLRGQQSRNQIEINPLVEVSFVKVAPALIEVDAALVKSDSFLEPSLQKIKEFAAARYPLHQVGVPKSYQTNSNKGLFIIASVITAATLGIVAALIKVYFKNY